MIHRLKTIALGLLLLVCGSASARRDEDIVKFAVLYDQITSLPRQARATVKDLAKNVVDAAYQERSRILDLYQAQPRDDAGWEELEQVPRACGIMIGTFELLIKRKSETAPGKFARLYDDVSSLTDLGHRTLQSHITSARKAAGREQAQGLKPFIELLELLQGRSTEAQKALHQRTEATNSSSRDQDEDEGDNNIRCSGRPASQETLRQREQEEDEQARSALAAALDSSQEELA